MTDNITLQQRRLCMSNIKSKWTQQELKIHNFLKGNKIKHKMHPNILGSPDLILTENNTAVFLHGCFWHKCPKCYKEPKSKKSYWIPKIERNVKRDKKNAKILKKEGFNVLKIWEHQIKKDFDKVTKKIIKDEGKV